MRTYAFMKKKKAEKKLSCTPEDKDILAKGKWTRIYQLEQVYRNVIKEYNKGNKSTNHIEELYKKNWAYLYTNPQAYIEFTKAICDNLEGNSAPLLIITDRLNKKQEHTTEKKKAEKQPLHTTEDKDIEIQKWTQIYLFDQKYEAFIKQYKEQNKSTNSIEKLYKNNWPDLNENPEIYLEFLCAIEDNLDGDSEPLLMLTSKLNEEFNYAAAQAGQHLIKEFSSVRATAGRKIDSSGKRNVFNELDALIEKEKKESNEKGIIEEYWQNNEARCRKLGWNKHESLERAYREYLKPTKSSKLPFPLKERYPWLMKDFSFVIGKLDNESKSSLTNKENDSTPEHNQSNETE